MVVDLETTGGSPHGLRDHRDRRGQGARRRGARRVPDPGRPRRADPAVHLGAHRHHRRDGRRRAAARLRAAGLPRVRRRHREHACWSRTTRRSTSAFLKAACAMTGHEWPGHQVLDTARLARQVVTRDEAPNCKLASLARLFRAGTTPDHRALSDARATVDVLHGLLERLGNLGVRSLDELATLLLAGLPRPAAQAAPGRGPPARARRLPVRRRARRGALRRQEHATCAPGSAPTSRPARPAAGWPRWSASPRSVTPIVCATDARGRGARAAADRRAQAALQPPVAVPRAGAAGSSSPSRRSRGCPWCARSGTTARSTSVRSPAPGRSSWPALALHEAFRLRQCTSRLSPRKAVVCLRPRRDGPVRRARATAARPSRPTPSTLPPCDRRCSATSGRSSTPFTRKVARSPRSERYEEAAVHRDRLAVVRAGRRSAAAAVRAHRLC